MIKIETKVGNLMNVQTGHIVHGCNSQGVMGSGVALAVKETYPEAYANYFNTYSSTGLTLGKAYPVKINKELMIWNAITQDNYGSGRRFVSYDAVQTCFEDVNEYIEDSRIPAEVHIPMIGAGRGGGNWEIIKEIIEQTMDCPVTLWLPDDSVTTR